MSFCVIYLMGWQWWKALGKCMCKWGRVVAWGQVFSHWMKEMEFIIIRDVWFQIPIQVVEIGSWFDFVCVFVIFLFPMRVAVCVRFLITKEWIVHFGCLFGAQPAHPRPPSMSLSLCLCFPHTLASHIYFYHYHKFWVLVFMYYSKS